MSSTTVSISPADSRAVSPAPAPAAGAAPAVTEVERYLFDVRGYLVVPDVLTRLQIDDLREGLLQAGATQAAQGTPSDHNVRGITALGPAFRALIDQERILPYLEEWVGPDPRLDHEYGTVIRAQAGRAGAFHIHGGGTPHLRTTHYTVAQGRILATEVAVAYALTDVGPLDGGMGVIPGSHKASFPLPWAASPGPYPSEVVQSVPVRAGSAVIFTEALSHCTLPWRGDHDRLTLFYKYLPRNQQYRAPDPARWAWPDLSARQRRMLGPACGR